MLACKIDEKDRAPFREQILSELSHLTTLLVPDFMTFESGCAQFHSPNSSLGLAGVEQQ